MQHRPAVLLAIILGFFWLSSVATAQLPQQMPYQGIIELPNHPATANFTVSIWDAETQGKKLWEESHPNVPLSAQVNGALFSFMLGSVTPIPLKEPKQYWLQLIANGDTISPRSPVVTSQATRATDPTVSQQFSSDFGYSVRLPAAAKYNKLGSAVNVPGETEKQNWLISPGLGSIMVYYVKEGRMVPRNYQLLDSVHYFDADSLGRNGKIYRRVYIMKDYAVQIDILLTEKGQPEYADKVKAIFDSFIAPPTAIKGLQAWRYGRNAKEFEKGRYGNFTGPNR